MLGESGVCACGPLPLRCLSVSVAPSLRTYSAEVDAAAENYWKEAVMRKPNLFDGPVWCLRSHHTTERHGELQLHCELQRSSFKYVLYTHYSKEGQALRAEARSGACGLFALTQTSDGFFIFGKRSQRTACLPGHWHAVPAGQLDGPDIRSVLGQELAEEVGCDWSSVQDVQLLALVDAGEEQGHKYEFVFLLRLNMPAVEVYNLYLSAEDSYEHDALAFIRGPAATSGEAASTEKVNVCNMDDFLGGGYLLTDASRRALQLFFQVSSTQVPSAQVPSSAHRVGEERQCCQELREQINLEECHLREPVPIVAHG
mmetsp:Transcript_72527/g.137064  ORF Transcript_72527/g.137064 Transcript_72527/m.137064 type:complete len:314 (-) Transcript_72527:54-995(-)